MWHYLQKLFVLCISFSLIFAPITPAWAGANSSSLKTELEQSELPSHSTLIQGEIDEDVVDDELPSSQRFFHSDDKSLLEKSSQTTLFRQTISLLHKGIKYVTKHPLRTLVLILAASIPVTQAVTASGLNQVYSFTEDALPRNNTLQPMTISNCVEPCTFEFFFNQVSYTGPYGNLGFRPGLFESNNNATVTITAGNMGDQYIQGSMSNVNNWLSSAYFVPSPNYDQSTTASTLVWDSVTTPGTGPSGSITITATPVTDEPVITINGMALRRGQSVALTVTNINGESVDVYPSSLSYFFSNVEHGRFFLGSNPSADLTSVTQQTLENGEATFQHDGGGVPPSYVVTAFDGNAYSLPSQVSVSFTDVPPSTSNGTKKSIIIGVSAGVGGLLTLGSCLGLSKWAYDKSHKSSSNQTPAIELGEGNSTLYSSSMGMKWGYTSVIGELTGEEFQLFPDMSKKLAQRILTETGLHIDLRGQKQVKDYKISSGEFGKFRIARHRDKFIGVKVITGEMKINASLNEAKLQNEVESPHVLHVLDYRHYVPEEDDEFKLITEPTLFLFYDLLAFGNGKFFQTVFPLLKDPSLTERVRRHVAKGIIQGVHDIHLADIVHLDLHPLNIMLDKDGSVKVIDFGTAKRISELDKREIGHINYFSPWRWAWRRHLDDNTSTDVLGYFPGKESDIFATGILLFEMFFNRQPFPTEPYNDMLNTWDYTKYQLMIDAIPEIRDPKPNSIEALIRGFFSVNERGELSLMHQLPLKTALTWGVLQEEIPSKEGLEIFNGLRSLESAYKVEHSQEQSSFYPTPSETSGEALYNNLPKLESLHRLE